MSVLEPEQGHPKPHTGPFMPRVSLRRLPMAGAYWEWGWDPGIPATFQSFSSYRKLGNGSV